ncbi:ABC transporter substrate-binding protein [Georgenia halophila]|uniref:ABC transporter substrate-binding protein n=2 Tax=Georgenia halophila TaxID=620889 RepID=A0ABP8LFG0_9MICO
MNVRTRTAAALAVATLALTGCAGGTSAPEGQEGTSGGQEDDGSGALGPEALDEAGEAEITWCAQKDSSGQFTAVLEAFNSDPANEGVTLSLLEFPASTDEWRNQFIQRQQAESPECDIFGSDVVWTAELAQRGFIRDLTPYVESRADEFIPSTLETAAYDGSYWAVPLGTNVAFLYYRTDHLDSAPRTWQEAYAAGQANDGLIYQAAAYEGLTVNFVTLATAAGGTILSDDGKASAINSPENLAALEFMSQGIENGSVPPAVLTYMEEETRRAFEAGEATLAVNWTYAYVLGQDAPIADDFDIVALPAWDGGDASGVLGGVNLVVSAFSEHPEEALQAIDGITSAASQVTQAQKGLAPTLEAAYDDAAVQEALPFWETLRDGVRQATSRPVTPVYAQISRAIYTNVSAALSGEVSPAAALEQADADINEALTTF